MLSRVICQSLRRGGRVLRSGAMMGREQRLESRFGIQNFFQGVTRGTVPAETSTNAEKRVRKAEERVQKVEKDVQDAEKRVRKAKESVKEAKKYLQEAERYREEVYEGLSAEERLKNIKGEMGAETKLLELAEESVKRREELVTETEKWVKRREEWVTETEKWVRSAKKSLFEKMADLADERWNLDYWIRRPPKEATYEDRQWIETKLAPWEAKSNDVLVEELPWHLQPDFVDKFGAEEVVHPKDLRGGLALNLCAKSTWKTLARDFLDVLKSAVANPSNIPDGWKHVSSPPVTRRSMRLLGSVLNSVKVIATDDDAPEDRCRNFSGAVGSGKTHFARSVVLGLELLQAGRDTSNAALGAFDPPLVIPIYANVDKPDHDLIPTQAIAAGFAARGLLFAKDKDGQVRVPKWALDVDYTSLFYYDVWTARRGIRVIVILDEAQAMYLAKFGPKRTREVVDSFKSLCKPGINTSIILAGRSDTLRAMLWHGYNQSDAIHEIFPGVVRTMPINPTKFTDAGSLGIVVDPKDVVNILRLRSDAAPEKDTEVSRLLRAIDAGDSTSWKHVDALNWRYCGMPRALLEFVSGVSDSDAPLTEAEMAVGDHRGDLVRIMRTEAARNRAFRSLVRAYWRQIVTQGKHDTFETSDLSTVGIPKRVLTCVEQAVMRRLFFRINLTCLAREVERPWGLEKTQESEVLADEVRNISASDIMRWVDIGLMEASGQFQTISLASTPLLNVARNLEIEST